MATFSAPIVCGVDFSEHSRRALAFARVLADRLRQPLTIVTAIDPLLSKVEAFESGDFLDRARRDLEEFVNPIVGRPRQNGNAISFQVVVGEASAALLEAAAGVRGVMIVVGTHGLGRAHRLVFGSTTLRLMRAAARPVLAVPPGKSAGTDSDLSTGAEITRLVCGVDFNAASQAAATAAHALGAALSVPLVLVHAVVPLTVPTVWDLVVQRPEEDLLADARARLDGIASDLGKPVPACSARLGRPEDVLTAEAADGHALVVLGLGDATRHRPGTTALRVMAETRVPVLTVPVAISPGATMPAGASRV